MMALALYLPFELKPYPTTGEPSRTTSVNTRTTDTSIETKLT